MSTDRVSRLLADREGTCCDGDVDARLNALRDHLPAAAAVERDVRTCGAVADGTRYRLLRVLHGAGEELCVCELTPLFEVSESAVSHALTDLVEADLVARRKDGRWRHYRTTDRTERLLDALGAGREDR
jgi:DNA-binding transcriptional ArsR family regulator